LPSPRWPRPAHLQTGRDNRRAQAVYERVGAKRSEWLEYAIDLTPGPAAIVCPLDWRR
jgi:hypothetical protein